MAQAWEYSVVIMRLKTAYLYAKRAVCPSALLRVPRASRSSLTSAEHPGKPLFGLFLHLRKNLVSSNGHGVSAAAWTWGFAKSRRSPKGAGDIRGGRHVVAAAGLGEYAMPVAGS